MGLFKKRDRVLGVDISPTAVKLVEIGRAGGGWQVEAIAVEPLPEGAVENRNPIDADEVGRAIKRAIKISGTGLKQAAVAVPASSVITRTISMPAEFGEDEIETNIQLEAAQYVPFPLEEIYLDFQVQGATKGSSDLQDVMLVASRKENVDLREAALREAGLKTLVVDVESYALENAFGAVSARPDQYEEDARVALVDVGASVTTLYVLQGSDVIYTREQPFGGDHLTTSIADHYRLDHDQAELAKRSGELSEDYQSAILDPYKQFAAEQIGHALQFFFSSSHFNSVDRIVLTGGGAMASGLDKAVASRLGVPTVIGNPFDGMSTASRVNHRSLLRDAPLLAVACGLALRSFD